MDKTILNVVVIFILLVANGIFAMSEIAMISAKKVRLKQKADNGDASAKTALELAENPNRFLSTTQIGITLIGILAGALGGATLSTELGALISKIEVLAPYSEGIAFTIVVLLTTYFSLVIGELIPKRLAMGNPEKIAAAVAIPMQALSKFTAPIVHLLSRSTELGLKIIGADPSTDPPITEEEIRILMKQGTQVGIFEEAEEDMVTGVFRLGDRFIDSIMTPRTEIEWIDLEETNESILEQIISSSHTRFPAALYDLDNVQGILSAKDFLAGYQTDTNINLQKFIQPPLFVPDSMSALKVLENLKQAGMHVALVLDEFGGLLGMVTLYDILKAIVGGIPTAGEEPEPQAILREDGSWLLDGLLSIDEFKDTLLFPPLPDEDRVGYQTLGGFVMSQFGEVPISGMAFEWNNYRFEVVDMDGRRIDKVLVTPLNPDNNYSNLL